MNTRIFALLAALSTSIIYGVSFTIAKDVMPQYVKPYGFIVLRVFGAMLLFWFISLFGKKEKIDKKDYPKIAIAAFFGVAFNMLTFFKGLTYTSPITAASIMVTAPILVLILSYFMLKEKIETKKLIGVVIGMIGAIVLITYGHSGGNNSNAIFGNFLVFVNALSFATYMVLAKKLTKKYHPFTFVKWLYTFGFIMVLPFGLSQVSEIQWETINDTIMWKIGFVVFFTTFITYLFNLLAIDKLKPTTVSVFIYVQPIVATIYALSQGKDSLNVIKVSATLVIFLGVSMVTKPLSNLKKFKDKHLSKKQESISS
ncbi:DMT family transporter [Aureivirga sp. CE67]|uniref:DMT family transporter n=1 Tax=Aureivirga sp. CE67 TaxID=1788983 RepID=UPI0018C9623E|nr:EamA family transporter [Aureivirga sp. CE67]